MTVVNELEKIFIVAEQFESIEKCDLISEFSFVDSEIKLNRISYLMWSFVACDFNFVSCNIVYS